MIHEAPLCEERFIVAKDLRDYLAMAPSTFGDLMKREVVEYIPKVKNQQRSRYLGTTEVKKLLTATGHDFASKTERITVHVSKGGVGKSTSTYFLASRLASLGFSTLVIDADAQGNISQAFSPFLKDTRHELNDKTAVLIDVIKPDGVTAGEAIIPITDTLHLLPSTPNNCTIDRWIDSVSPNQSLFFSKILGKIESQYHFIFIDCAPSFSLINGCAMSYADVLLAPTMLDSFSIMSLSQTIAEADSLQEAFKGSGPHDIQLLVCQYDARLTKSNATALSALTTNYHDLLLPSMIRTSSDCRGIIAEGRDLFTLQGKSTARQDYADLAWHFVGRRRSQESQNLKVA